MNHLLCGLTGGIACGKSTVAKLLAEKPNLMLIDTDKLAKEIIQTNLAAVSVLLGFKKEATLKDIAKLIFNDSGWRKILEVFVHPLVEQQMTQMISESKAAIIVVESALIFETNWQKHFQLIISAVCPEAIQIDRGTKRGLSYVEMKARMDCQLSQDFKKNMSDTIIDTDCELDELKRRVDALYEQLVCYRPQ
jgi:dephospho-CoA kinase